jgi:hypothetical protein
MGGPGPTQQKRRVRIPTHRSGRPSTLTGGRAFFHSGTPPGPQSFGKKGNGPDAVVRARCRWPRQGRGNHSPNTGLGGFIWVVPELPKGQTRQPLPRWFGERTFSDPYVSDPVEERPPWCICDRPAYLKIDVDAAARCVKCGLSSPRTVICGTSWRVSFASGSFPRRC